MKKPVQTLLAAGAFFATLALWGGWNYLTGSFKQKQLSSLIVRHDKLAGEAALNNRLTLLKPIARGKIKKDETPTLFYDMSMTQKWGLEKTDTGKAWKISQGSRDIVIAIIDTGADIRHPDLKHAIWTNPGETGLDSKGRDKAKNGVDDDSNGFIDDVHGWNFAANNNDLSDSHGHGTHVAGIIGADSENKIGAAGIAPRSSLMILKYYDPKGPQSDNLKNTIAAIRYANQMNARIINYSGGGVSYSTEEYQAIAEARDKKILFVAAAGNNRTNSDKNPYYPADYKLDNIISVTAIDPHLKVLASSNYGVETVDIAAPGEEIYSTFPGNSYGHLTGTSQATAFVTGVAALVLATNREFSAIDARKYILKTGDVIESLVAKTGTSRKLNSYRALAIHDQGLSLTGLKASNTAGMDPNTFTSDPQANLNNSAFSEADGLAQFGRILIKSLDQAGPAAAEDTETIQRAEASTGTDWQ